MAEINEATRLALPVVFSTFSTVSSPNWGTKPSWRHCSSQLSPARPGWFPRRGLGTDLLSLVGVLLGQWLARTLPPERLETMAGVLMVALGLWLGLRQPRRCCWRQPEPEPWISRF